MPEPLTELRQRPFLVPLLLPLLALLLVAAGAVWLSTGARTTVVILVRHAEAAASTSGDPELSPRGEQRAGQLGAFLADALGGLPVNHIYAADTRRAQQTAASVANQFKLPINLLGGSDWDGLARRIKATHRGETVVVVGYASTLPGVVNHLSARRISLDADDHGSIFVVVLPRPGQPRVLRLRYGDALDASGQVQ